MRIEWPRKDSGRKTCKFIGKYICILYGNYVISYTGGNAKKKLVEIAVDSGTTNVSNRLFLYSVIERKEGVKS